MSEKKYVPTAEDYYFLVRSCIDGKYEAASKEWIFSAVVGVIQAILDAGADDPHVKEAFIKYAMNESAAGLCLRGCLAAFIQETIEQDFEGTA